MKALRIVPEISYFDTFEKFAEESGLGKGDVIVTESYIYDRYVKAIGSDAKILFHDEYGSGEPTDEIIDAMAADLKKLGGRRIIAFGGGTIVDVCKVLALEIKGKSVDIFTGKEKPVKERELIAIPTTCGTGSEVTNVAIAELKSLNVKMGLAAEETYADKAVLIPEALENLPDYVFATSSIDALIHASESYLSPKASPFTEMYSLSAIKTIIRGYRTIAGRGGNSRENRKDLLKSFCFAANYAGIAFGNAGCAAVHAMSYALGGTFHVPHGEANYQLFTEVFKMYMKKAPDGKIAEINRVFASELGCSEDDVYDELENLLNRLIAKKPLREYGMTEKQIDEFTESTVKNQQRLLANNYVYLEDYEIREIFANLY